MCGNKSICRFSGLFAGDLFRMVSNRFFGYYHESIVAWDARDRTNFDPTEWIHRLKRAKQIYSEQITKIAKKIKLSEKIPVGWIKKTLTYARSRRLPRSLTKTLSSCKYGPKTVFLPFFLNGKRVFSEKYRILSLSGQFTLLEHDFGFMNRENMTIEKF